MTDMKRVLKLFIYKISQVENEKLLRNFIRGKHPLCTSKSAHYELDNLLEHKFS